MTDSELADK